MITTRRIFARILQETIKRSAPDCRIFTTTGLTSDLPVDAWVVPLSPSTYLPEKQKAAVARGNEIWYYNRGSELNDLHYIRNRIFSWRVYAADGQGALMWRTMQIPAGVNPWTELDRTYNCGSATFILPPCKGKGGVVPTLRLVNMRDGIDDFDYLKLLERKLEHYYPGKGRKFVLELLYAIFTEPPFDHTGDSEKLAALREKIGDELDRIDLAPAGAWVSSIPAAGRAFELPEITISAYAPAGTAVLLNGKIAGKTGAKGKLRFKTVLQKFGNNELIVQTGGKKFALNYTLLEDPNIAALKKAAADSPLKEAKVLLDELKKAPVYNAALRSKAAAMVQKVKQKKLETELERKPRQATEPGNHFRKRARELFKYGLFERTQKMLDLAATADRMGDMKNHAVKLTPVEYKDHPGVLLDNGKIALTLLETGGRVISFKVNGIECFHPGSLNAILSRKERAVNNIPRKKALLPGGYGGFEDAGGGSSLRLYPVQHQEGTRRVGLYAGISAFIP